MGNHHLWHRLLLAHVAAVAFGDVVFEGTSNRTLSIAQQTNYQCLIPLVLLRYHIAWCRTSTPLIGGSCLRYQKATLKH
ncbi:MAG: hypothetical protein R3C17_05245 [Planctomycetaceae bacterium]